MKKSSLLIIIFIFIMAITAGCDKQPTFDGSRTSNDVQFIMEYSVLNDTKTHEMELKQGSIIDVIIENKSGRLDIIVKSADGQEIYRGNNASSDKFSINIQKTGKYKFLVTGAKAKGSISFKVRT